MELILLVVILYVLMCLYFGFKSAGRITNLKEFALGYKQISTAILVATMYATHLGAGSSLGLIEQINNVGIVCIIATIGGVSRWYTSRAIFCKNVGKFSDCVSHAHVMGKLYGPFGFTVSNLVNVFCSIGIVAVQVVVIGFIAQYFLKVSTEIGILLGTIVVISYSTSGGIKAVILTDLVQIILFGIVIAVVFLLSAQKMVEQPNFFQLIPQSKMWVVPYDLHSTLLVMGMVVYALIPVGGNAPFIQRILISGSASQLYRVFSYAALLDFLAMFAITAIAILLLPTTGEGNLSKIDMFNIINASMPLMLVAVVVIGIIAITMSTADSWLNSGAVIVTHFIFNKRQNLPDSQQVKIARLVTVLMGVAAAQVALLGDSVLSLLLCTTCFMEPMILIPLAAGFLGYEFTHQDYKRSVVVALISVLIGGYIEGKLGFISLLFGLVGSAVGLSWGKKWQWLVPSGGGGAAPPFTAKQQSGKANPLFFAKLGGLGLLWALAHLYIDQSWMLGELAIVGCFTAIALALLLWVYVGDNCLRYDYGHVLDSEFDEDIFTFDAATCYKFCAMLAIALLLVAVSSFAFRTGNPLAIILLGLTMLGIFFYRQYTTIAAGLALGLASLNHLSIVIIAPSIPLSVLAVGMLFSVTFCGYCLVQELISRFKDERKRRQLATKQRRETASRLINTEGKLMATREKVLEVKEQLTLTAKLLEEERIIATTDALTTLYNRRYLDDELANVVKSSRARNTELSIMVLDIDKFKQLNDFYGSHAVGDECLRELARRIKASVRTGDICARFGGDEFVIIMPNADLAEGQRVAERLRATVAATPFAIPLKPWQRKCTISIGVTSFCPADDAASLMKRADSALYAAKGKDSNSGEGRNRVWVLPANAPDDISDMAPSHQTASTAALVADSEPISIRLMLSCVHYDFDGAISGHSTVSQPALHLGMTPYSICAVTAILSFTFYRVYYTHNSMRQ